MPQQCQSLFQVRAGSKGNRNAELAFGLASSEFGRWKQIFVEVLELTAAGDGDVARPYPVLQFRHGTQFVELAIDSVFLENERLPALADEIGRCIGRQLAGAASVQLLERVNGADHTLHGGGAAKLEGFQKHRLISAELLIVFADQAEMIEVFIAG